MVKNPPANAGDTGSSPGLRGSHMPWSNQARAPQLPSLRSRAREPQLLKPAHLEPMLCNTRSHHNEKPTCRNEDPAQPQINKKIYLRKKKERKKEILNTPLLGSLKPSCLYFVLTSTNKKTVSNLTECRA